MVLKFDVKPKNILLTLILRFLIRSNTWHTSKAMYALPRLCTYNVHSALQRSVNFEMSSFPPKNETMTPKRHFEIY